MCYGARCLCRSVAVAGPLKLLLHPSPAYTHSGTPTCEQVPEAMLNFNHLAQGLPVHGGLDDAKSWHHPTIPPGLVVGGKRATFQPILIQHRRTSLCIRIQSLPIRYQPAATISVSVLLSHTRISFGKLHSVQQSNRFGGVVSSFERWMSEQNIPTKFVRIVSSSPRGL